MKKLLVSLFLLVQVVCAETYVHPLRADLGIENKTAMMPYEAYTGTTSWAVGNLVSNELVDFSPARNNLPLVDSPLCTFALANAGGIAIDGGRVFRAGVPSSGSIYIDSDGLSGTAFQSTYNRVSAPANRIARFGIGFVNSHLSVTIGDTVSFFGVQMADASKKGLVEWIYDGTNVTATLDGVSFSEPATAGVGAPSTDGIAIGRKVGGIHTLSGKIAACTVSGQRSIDVVIFMGQSNMDGATGTTGATLPEHNFLQQHLLRYYSDADIIALSPRSAGSGCELEFGVQMTAFGKTLAVIKVSKGSTSMHTDWQKGGEMYSNLVAGVAAGLAELKNQGYEPTIKAVVQWQGESDVATNANEYLANLTQFITDAETDEIFPSSYHWMDMEIVGGGANVTIVNSAKQTYASSVGGDFITTADLPNDGVHFTQEAQKTVGQRVASNYLASVVQVTDTEGVVHWWPMEEESGLAVYDATGAADGLIDVGSGTIAAIRTGTYDAAAYFAGHGGSKAIYFGGEGTTSDVVDTNLFNFGTDDFTIEFLMEWGGKQGSQILMTKGALSTANIGWYINVRDDSNSDIRLITSPDGAAQVINRINKNVITDGWHTIKITKTGTAVAWHVDGVLQTDILKSAVTGVNPSTLAISFGNSLLSSVAWVEIVSGGITRRWDGAQSHSGEFAEIVNGDSATLGSHAGYLYLPALSDGSDDVAGLGITNPRGLTHNNGSYSIQIGSTINTYANLLTNSVNIVTNSAGLIEEIWE